MKHTFPRGATIIEVIVFLITLLAFGGWIANIVKLIDSISDSTSVTTMFIARCIGVVFAPLGAILGFF